jgi:hypothetical protein
MSRVAALVSVVAMAAACNQVPSFGTSNPASQAAAPAVPVTVTCAPGQQALVKQMTMGGQTVSQVQCVADQTQTVAMRDSLTLDDQIQVAPVRRAAAKPRVVRQSLPPVVREEPAPVREARNEDDDDYYDRDRDREEPVVTRTSTRDDDDRQAEPVRKTRSGEKSAVIIAGSTAAGAGAGAIIGGKKGAIIGAVLGGVGGTIYDRKTRHGK